MLKCVVKGNKWAEINDWGVFWEFVHTVLSVITHTHIYTPDGKMEMSLEELLM